MQEQVNEFLLVLRNAGCTCRFPFVHNRIRREPSTSCQFHRVRLRVLPPQETDPAVLKLLTETPRPNAGGIPKSILLKKKKPVVALVP